MRAGLLFFSLFYCACGTGQPQIPPELLTPGGAGAAGEQEYPAAPYGVEPGAVIENFKFSGYLEPDVTTALSDVEFAQFYDPDGALGNELILLNTAAAWCQPCRIEHATLPKRADEFRAQGLVILALLFQDSAGQPPSEETLEIWTSSFATNFPMALDPSFQMGRYGSAENPPLNLVVDARTMTILKQFVGNQDEALWSFIGNELEKRSSN